MKTRLIIAFAFIATFSLSAIKPKDRYVEYNYGVNNKGTTISITFEKGKEHNHPLFAIWLADSDGKYLQTLYVSKSIGHGIFIRANRREGKWMGGEIDRPASLPYWAHQRNIKNKYGTYMPTPKNPILDAYSGATPPASFVLHSITENVLSGKYKIMFELNQSWDWNEFWTNDMYPNEPAYSTSSQPAIIYSVDIDTEKPEDIYQMKLIGHSHYSGANGQLFSNLNTITTAKKIAKNITVKVQ